MVLKNIKLGKTHTVTGQVAVPIALASGLGWYVVRENVPILYYLTGENPERENRIVLTEDECARIVDADDSQGVMTAIIHDRQNRRDGFS